VRNGRPGESEGAARVHRHHRLVVVVAELPHDAVTQDAGVVDEHVDPAGLGHDAGHDGIGLCAVGDVGGQPHRPDLTRGLGEDVGFEVHEVDGRPRRPEMPADRPADTASGAGDEHGTAGEVEGQVCHHAAITLVRARTRSRVRRSPGESIATITASSAA
jgi:hypothetical protein